MIVCAFNLPHLQADNMIANLAYQTALTQHDQVYKTNQLIIQQSILCSFQFKCQQTSCSESNPDSYGDWGEFSLFH